MNGHDNFDQHTGGDPSSNDDKRLRLKEESTSNYNGSDADTFTDSNETYNSRDDNTHTSNSDSNNKKRGKTICYDFQKGLCRRRNCRVN